ncbi:alpha-mannosidase [Cellulomonas marina]|uniref:Alpha-mannosidase n=1 Tax=Cellulomonas marina TaxID=988821 RepID=A0A1I1A6N5_9CELL|nr:glycoside hydrolase family 38 C-terminal domain-containing protein [Cellulomonas marina]GIG29558.1 alpha-mannosidase [Cellulomonas marina]SFB33036.1 alpha-mannosidase [Cellulomonas marina]
MHRNLTEQSARTTRVPTQRIVPATWSHRTPLQVTVTHLPGEPEPFAEAVRRPFVPTAVGEPRGRPWSTSWFHLRGRVPQEMAGRRVELLVDLGFTHGGPGFQCEGLVWTADGVPLKGVEPRNAWVLVAREAQGGEEVDLYVEAAANPHIPGPAPTDLGDPATLPTAPLYRLARAELAVLEEDVHGLALDVQVLHGLAATLPEHDPRRAALERGLGHAIDELDVADVVGTAGKARAHLADLLAQPATASAHRVSAVGHAHIDSAWMWPVRETVRKCARTFSNVVSLAQDYPELVFACSSAQQYAWMAEHHPAVMDGIRRTVATGQWVPVGGMWVESDTNLPGGESMVRQLVQGTRWFERELGVRPREVWLPDSFGYSGALPQLFRLAGAEAFLSQKMSWNATNRFPHHTFWWEGIDGTRVFTHFPPAETYGSTLSAAELAHGVRTFADHGGATRSLLPFGYGDGGGGPTREMLEVARRVADLEGSPRVRIESPAAFFAAAREEYADAPVWSGELYLEFHRGTYTSQHAMKAGNRRTEHLLREAELWCATAAVRTGAPYPHAALDRAWQDALLLQFHDILPGSSIAWVHAEARATYARLAAELEALVDAAQTALAGTGDLPLAFNAAPHALDEVPALGAAPAHPVTAPVAVRALDDGGFELDDGLLRVRVDGDGTIGAVRDLVAGREVLPPGTAANVLQLHPDQPVRFDAWDVDEHYRHRVRELRALESVRLDAADPACPRVVIERRDGASRYVQTVALPAGRRRVDLTLEVDWHEREHLLKAAFPLAVHADRSTAETQFGHVHRDARTNTSWDAARFEVCAHRWLHVGEPGYGVALVNAATYGHEVVRPGPGDARGPGATTVRLSLLRAPLFPDPGTDQGRHVLRYALVPGAGIDDAVVEGYRANLPVRTRRGAAPVAPLVVVEGGGAVVEAVKLADDGSGDVVVRLYESLGGRGRVVVRPGFPTSGARVVDLHERDEPAVAALSPLEPVDPADPARRADEGAVALTMRPFQVVTLRLARA